MMEIFMNQDYVKLRKQLEEDITKLGSELPGPMSGFARLHRKGVEDAALSRKIKELMAVAISIATGCEGCIVYHTHDAIQAGATREELLETIGVAILMGGGPCFHLRHLCHASHRAAHARRPVRKVASPPVLELKEE
jgi:AhpD family alkylhydroperoxidase